MTVPEVSWSFPLDGHLLDLRRLTSQPARHPEAASTPTP
jgi:hypothetical protein